MFEGEFQLETEVLINVGMLWYLVTLGESFSFLIELVSRKDSASSSASSMILCDVLSQSCIATVITVCC